MGLLQTVNNTGALVKVGAAVLGAVAATALFRRARTTPEEVPDSHKLSNGSRRLATTHFNQERFNRNRRAARVLMGWSILNLATGAVGFLTNGGSRRHFHELNMGFGTLSALATAIAARTLSHRDPEFDDTEVSLSRARRLERVLSADLAGSLAFLAGGALLAERGRNEGSDPMRGYGSSLILQGCYFACFDTIMLGLNNRHRRTFENKIAPFTGLEAIEPETRV